MTVPIPHEILKNPNSFEQKLNAIERNQSKQPWGFDSPLHPLHLGTKIKAKEGEMDPTYKVEIHPGSCRRLKKLIKMRIPEMYQVCNLKLQLFPIIYYSSSLERGLYELKLLLLLM